MLYTTKYIRARFSMKLAMRAFIVTLLEHIEFIAQTKYAIIEELTNADSVIVSLIKYNIEYRIKFL